METQLVNSMNTDTVSHQLLSNQHRDRAESSNAFDQNSINHTQKGEFSIATASNFFNGKADRDDSFFKISDNGVVKAFDNISNKENGIEETETSQFKLIGEESQRKLTKFQTFFAILKAYCAINVLLLPLSFVNGGFILSPIMMIIACFFETLCAIRLSTVAYKYKIWSYPEIARRAMGDKGFQILRLLLTIAHIQFTIGQLSFTLKSLSSTFTVWLGATEALPYWIFAIAVFFIYSPIAWVRTLEYFANAFIFSMAMIALAVITTSVYCFNTIQENDGAPGPEFVPVNKSSYFAMVGFAFFMFEGIGCLLPVMKETKEPEHFTKITVAALVTLCTIYVLFSFLCYYTWGTDLDETVVTEMLPTDNTFIQIMKLLFCINLVFSYPMTNSVTHTTFQEYVFGHSYAGRYEIQEEKAHFWKVNILRSCILAFSLSVTVFAADALDKVFAICGAVLGMSNVLLIPSICHLKLLAETRDQRIKDILIIIFAIFMIFFGPATIIMQW